MNSKKEVARKIFTYFSEHSKPNSTLSPICQRILGTVAGEIDSLGWLVESSANRTALETSLLLMSGMHRQVLLGATEVDSLKEYYPSVGGNRDFRDVQFSGAFLDALDKCKEKLAPLIEKETIQTNETQRGLFWLLPAILTGWQSLHLVDLGASAGLNLVADQRRFAFSDGEKEISFGLADSQQFVTQMKPSIPDALVGSNLSVPSILSRNGCDLHPFSLRSDLDRTKLESFVWPDQLQRFYRLKEGVKAHGEVVRLDQSIAVAEANLPHDLPPFLESLDYQDDSPVVIYNTYTTSYLENQGRDLRGYIDDWACRANRKVMWVQAEPGENTPVKPHWCNWTIDLWEKDASNYHWHLAWTHPHGTEMDILPGLDNFIAYKGT